MKQWYFDLAEFKPEEGFEFQLVGGEEGKLLVKSIIIRNLLSCINHLRMKRTNSNHGKFCLIEEKSFLSYQSPEVRAIHEEKFIKNR